jgi:lipopolysaccharide/colanic/teichoic acid biosynthesis glycosyltransferase
MKYAIDVFLVVLLLPIVLPLSLLAATAIRVTMGRPVLFIQERVGLGGGAFRMYKFRTMRHMRWPADVTTATVVNDGRITPLGSWLRRFRIDELPQLWNVLRSDMSIIGPRPEQPTLCDKYTSVMPTFPCRHVVRPGITGWAQVLYGYAGDAQETREKLSYDLFYVKYISLSLDLKILMETVLIIIYDKNVR